MGNTEAASVGETMGSWDGARLGSTSEGVAARILGLAGDLEDTMLAGAGLAGAPEGTVLTDIKLLGTLEDAGMVVPEPAGTVSLGHTVASSWAPPSWPEEQEVPVEEIDTAGPGDALERARGWKETDGETGPWGGMGLETVPASGHKCRRL